MRRQLVKLVATPDCSACWQAAMACVRRGGRGTSEETPNIPLDSGNR
jgi:hypothetical protein